MKIILAALVLFACINSAVAADWKPIERTVRYEIAGANGPELYTSIGTKGPLIGDVRTIAHTNWDLKWSRNYVPEGAACVLVSAKPFLTITTTLPKPKGNAGRNWQVFIDGIVKHERVHGMDIIAMVDEIIVNTVGLRVDNDAECTAIRAQVLVLVRAANETYKAKSRAFDRLEMSDGGAMQRLVLALVNEQQ